VRQRKTTLVTIPSNHPRIAVKMTIHTSDTVDELDLMRVGNRERDQADEQRDGEERV
jgi:hypothetical protein